jgi:hypothetical protein
MKLQAQFAFLGLYRFDKFPLARRNCLRIKGDRGKT